jgi:hypothetical protein
LEGTESGGQLQTTSLFCHAPVTLPDWAQAGTVPLVRFSARASMSEKLLVFQSVDYVQVVDLRLNARQAVHLAGLLPAPSKRSPVSDMVYVSGGDFSADGHSFFVGSLMSGGSGYLWEFPLQEVPTLLDLAMAFVQVNFSDHWTEEECAQKLPSDLMATLFPSLPGDDDTFMDSDESGGSSDAAGDDSGEEHTRLKVSLSRLLLQALGGAALGLEESSSAPQKDARPP